MYINIPTWKNPYSTTPLTNAIGFIGVSNFDHIAGTGRIMLAIYPDRASADANLTPLATKSYAIPAVDATADAIVGGMSPGFVLPTLRKIETDNSQTFQALVGVFYALLLGDPDLQGATPLTEAT